MSSRTLAKLTPLAMAGVFVVATRWALSNLLGGLAGDWISGLLGSAIGVGEKQVIDFLTPWVLPVLAGGLAMWASYSYGARYGSPSSPNATAVPADIKSVTNPKLVDQVHAFTKRLRSFELIENGATYVEEMQIKAINAKIDFALRKEKSNIASQDAMKGEIAALELKASELGKARTSRRFSEFQAQFLQEATQLRAELCRRTGRPVGGADDPTTDILDKGKFKLESLSVLANHFHKMADRLPN